MRWWLAVAMVMLVGGGGGPAPLARADRATPAVAAQNAYAITGHQSLALDSLGRPHVAYGGNGLFYAWFDGATWQATLVEAGAGVGEYVALALDTSGDPHISYTWGSGDQLRYARRAGGVWTTQAVGAEVSWSTTLALTTGDQPRIGYYTPVSRDLKYAAWTGSAWEITTVEADGIVGAYPSLALDSGGAPHLSYVAYAGPTGASGPMVRHAVLSGASWITDTVDAGPSAGGYTSLVLDTADRPHLSYHADGASDLTYAYQTGSAWVTQTVDASGEVGWATALALDALERPHLAYMDHSALSLKYARWTGSAWDIVTLPHPLMVGWSTALALGPDGAPRIVFYDYWRDEIRYAYRTATAWHTLLVAGGDVRFLFLPLVGR